MTRLTLSGDATKSDLVVIFCVFVKLFLMDVALCDPVLSVETIVGL